MGAYTFDKLDLCPVCKMQTPHDSGLIGGGMVCKVCGVKRVELAVGAFRKCMHCDEWVPAREHVEIDVVNERIIVPALPEHHCKTR